MFGQSWSRQQRKSDTQHRDLCTIIHPAIAANQPFRAEHRKPNDRQVGFGKAFSNGLFLLPGQKTDANRRVVPAQFNQQMWMITRLYAELAEL